jgi:hypothetical protein
VQYLCACYIAFCSYVSWLLVKIMTESWHFWKTQETAYIYGLDLNCEQIVIYFTHHLKLMKSVGSHGSLSLLFVMKVMMVWHSCYLCKCQFSLQSHRYVALHSASQDGKCQVLLTLVRILSRFSLEGLQAPEGEREKQIKRYLMAEILPNLFMCTFEIEFVTS